MSVILISKFQASHLCRSLSRYEKACKLRSREGKFSLGEKKLVFILSLDHFPWLDIRKFWSRQFWENKVLCVINCSELAVYLGASILRSWLFEFLSTFLCPLCLIFILDISSPNLSYDWPSLMFFRLLFWLLILQDDYCYIKYMQASR